MANELSISASLVYDPADDDGFTDSISDVLRTLSTTTNRFVKGRVSVATSEQAIDLGNLATLGWAFFVNLDETNYVEIRSATGASNDIIRLDPLTCALFRFGSDVSAPFMVANTAACLVRYTIYAG